MVLAQRLKQLRSESKLTATEVASKLGVAKSTISNYEKGIREPNLTTLNSLAKMYGTTLDVLLNFSGDDVPPSTSVVPVDEISQIPILSVIRASEPIYAEENVMGYTDLGSEYKGKGDYFAIYVEGDSMNKSRIYEGDMVIVRKQATVENNEIAVVLIDEECSTIKKIFRTEKTVTLIPSSTNTNHKPRLIDLKTSSVKILGKVIEVKIKL